MEAKEVIIDGVTYVPKLLQPKEEDFIDGSKFSVDFSGCDLNIRYNNNLIAWVGINYGSLRVVMEAQLDGCFDKIDFSKLKNL